MVFFRTTSALRCAGAWLVLWCAAGALSRASAQEQAPHVLTLQAVQQLAESRAPDVTLAAARADTAGTEVAVAGMFPNPRVTVGTTSGTAAIYGNLFVALPVFGQRESAVDAADAQARVAAAGVEVARLDARLAATTAWLSLWQVDAELGVASDNADRRERVLETSRTRFAEGAAPRLEVLRAETEARRARAEVSALREQRLAAVVRLLALLGGTQDHAFQVDGEPRRLDAPPAAARLDAMAAEHSLTRRARVLLHAADAVVTREHRARWPLVGVQLGGSFFERQPPPAHDISIGLTVELPLFNGPLITRAESARNTASTELDTVVVQLRARIAGARADYLAAVHRQEAQVREVLPAAQEAAELSFEAYRSGGLDLTGTLAAEQALSDTRLAAARLTADCARALAVLEHAVGRAL